LPVDYEVVDNVIRINCLNWAIEPSIEDSEACMGIVIDTILEVKNPERIILAETRENEYDYDQTKLLIEIANAYNKIVYEDKIVSVSNMGTKECEKMVPKRMADLQFLTLEVLRKDPIGAYVRLEKMIAYEKITMEKATPTLAKCNEFYIEHALIPIEKILSSCKLIQMSKPYLAKFRPGERRLYREFFHPLIKPNFMLTRYMMIPPKEGQRVDKYTVGRGIIVEIFKIPGKVRYVYHVTPPEFRLSEDKYTILDNARRYLAAHKPTETEFAEPEKAREVFFNIGKDLIKELSNSMTVQLTTQEIDELATILSRYTAGFGVLELLLADEKIQDVYINSPVGLTPIYILHSDYEECETNLIPTKDDAEAWGTRFRLLSGRPLDEANPVLDTELNVPGGRARVAAITRTLSPEGLGYAFRRHRDKPWTFPLFMNAKYMDPLYAGLMSFMIDGSRAILVAGGRSSGKTSLLGSMMLEIMKKFRIITVEDSVTGDSQIIFQRNGKMERKSIGELINEQIDKYGCVYSNDREILFDNPEKINVFSMTPGNKVVLSEVKSFIRHKVNKDIFEIETRTGRKIKVTGDHSLFSFDDNGEVVPSKVRNFKIGDYIVTPRILDFNNRGIKSINLIDYLNKINKGFFVGEEIRRIIVEKWDLIKEITKKLNYSKTMPSAWKRSKVLPVKVFEFLNEKNLKYDKNKIYYKHSRNSRAIPTEIYFDEDLLAFIGLWLADGCYDKKSVILSVDGDLQKVVYNIGKRYGIPIKMHTDDFSLMLNSVTLKFLMKDIFELTGDAYTKEMPRFIYNLSKEQIGWVLKGIFSGDGYLTESEVAINLASENLINHIQSLLLTFGIISRVNFIERDKTFSCRISALKGIKEFSYNISFLQKKRIEKLSKIKIKISTHDSTDVIPFPIEFKQDLPNVFQKFNYHDYIRRGQNIGREKLKTMIVDEQIEFGANPKLEFLNLMANSDIFWDQIRSIKKIKSNGYVYDLSVPENENFICENILAHNTLELPVVALRQLGYNIERMKSRSVITRVEAELPADEALRTALRLGDSCLIVGEVRSVEALALFEAMRIGALANIVAGTIHGESAYGVFDRVVNDLKVPPTSFKAIDLITICNMLRSPDGLHRFRRVIELTEVRKHWKTDPLDEGGFVSLMEYSSKEDRLKPTDTLVDGESMVLNDIAKRVREWHGDWDAVWENILLRAKIKETMANYAKQLNRADILEANWTCDGNEIFHIISDNVKQEVGALDNKMIYERWLDWFKNRMKENL